MASSFPISSGLRPVPAQFLTISEKQFQAWIVEVLRLGGWRYAHFRPAQTQSRDAAGRQRWSTPMSGDVGWPDITIAHRGKGKLLFRELKSEAGKVSPEQVAWIADLRAGGADAAVWRPRHKHLIEATLMHQLPTKGKPE